MSASAKPWLRARREPESPYRASINSGGPSPISSTSFDGLEGAHRPVVPPRVALNTFASSGYGSYGSYANSYTPSYGPAYSGYMYNSPSYMGVGLPSYRGVGMPNGVVHQAQDTARHAFQSVENIVSGFSSISMMLESSYSALLNSFHAVLGVADHFGRLKVQLTQIFSSLATFRVLRWLYKKVLVLLRLRGAHPNDESWSYAFQGDPASSSGEKFPLKNNPSWPILLFSAIVIGGPWLMWKMLSTVIKTKESRDWLNGGEHVVGEARYRFQAESQDELNIMPGQRLMLAPSECQPRLQHNDWLLASTDGVTVGWVPANHVTILGIKKSKKEPIEASQAADQLSMAEGISKHA